LPVLPNFGGKKLAFSPKTNDMIKFVQ
jgi:hypothetical protein